MKDSYQRISCDLYDQLESYATHKTKLHVVFKEGEKIHEEIFQILDFKTKNKAEYLLSNTGKIIRLDQIISIEKLL